MKRLKMHELGRLTPEEFKLSPKLPLVLVLDNIRSMHNVGAIFRNADAFRIHKIYLCGYTACPPHRDIRKVAVGAEESVDWEHHRDIGDLLHILKSQQYKLIAVEQTDKSIPLPDFRISDKEELAFVLGNEVDGVQDCALDLCDAAVAIPQSGTKHSLNVSVAAGIVLYAVANRQFDSTGFQDRPYRPDLRESPGNL